MNSLLPNKSLERTRGEIKCQAQTAAAAALSSTVRPTTTTLGIFK